MRTVTGCHTGREKTGAKTPMALVNAIGKESIAILSGEENRGFHCRSILTQIPINGQSRAELSRAPRLSRPARSASDRRHCVARSYTLSRDTTQPLVFAGM